MVGGRMSLLAHVSSTHDPSVSGPAEVSARSFPATRLAVLTILTVMTAQVVFLTVGCDWDLSGDEAEFWTWSRRLDWSYFARGPLIAWLIGLSTWVGRVLNPGSTVDTMPEVRIPAVLLGGLTAWGVFRLSMDVVGRPRAALLAVLLMPAIPVLAIGGVLITCDTPLVCCWTWAAVWCFRAWRDDRLMDWVAAGFIVAAGVLAKYSMLALPASVGLFLLLDRRGRAHLIKPGFWVMSVIGVILGLAPIVIWNANHHWVGLGQLADRVGLSERSVWGSIVPLFAFLGGEIAALGIVWWFVGFNALISAGRRVVGARAETEAAAVGERSGLIYLLCLWGVIWSACFVASLLGETEANWMVPGYISLVVLSGVGLERIFLAGGFRPKAIVVAWSGCVALISLLHHTEWTYPLAARFVPAPTKRWPAPLRRFDPTCRLRGHDDLARQVDLILAKLRARGEDPFVLTTTYALTATMEFQLAGQPETYCLSWNYGMTRDPVNQHDLWRPNPRLDLEAFRGRTGVLIDDSNMPPSFANQMVEKGVFGSMESTERLVVSEGGLAVGAWDIAICHDYRGLASYKQNPWKKQK